MKPDFKLELRHFISKPDELLPLSEFDIRNNILKFFRGMGWNVYNEGLSPLDYEVLQEKRIKSGRPDLTFQIGGSRKFYIETKRASVEMGAKDIWQAWKYAWNSGLSFSILSNYLKTWLIDCRTTPPNEPPKDWRGLVVREWDLPRYEADFEEIKSLVGKTAVERGSLSALEEKLSEAIQYPAGMSPTLFPLRGVQPVDSLFLNQLDLWRIKIAGNFFSRGVKKEKISGLADKVINFMVFVRFLEDRGLLPENTLKRIMEKGLDRKGTLTRELNSLRSRLDSLYNGTVFKEANGEFSIDEPILADIIYNLYSPQSPYEFDYIPVDILGTIYERFLGKRISFDSQGPGYKDETESRLARKEGGVFYTERYITNFMASQILRHGLRPEDPEAIFRMRIADISCGSGSFLITVYRMLLFWFESICSGDERLREKYLERRPGGDWKLKIDYKIAILENCIYGVDIDPEAVDVTKFSLYLQLLEGETEKEITSFFSRERKPILPVLDKNIKCGNSLVDYSIAEQDLYSEEVEKIIKPFNLRGFFKDVFTAGGFDILVGNPPYSAKLHEMEKAFCRGYKLSKGNFNSANLFIERANELVRPGGAWSLIVPKSLIYSEKWIETRKHLKNNLLLSIDASKAFRNVKLEQVIIGCKDGSSSDNILTGSISKSETNVFPGPKALSFSDITPTNLPDKEIRIGEKIIKNSISFEGNFRLMRGTVPLASIRNTGEVKVYRGKFVQGYQLFEPSEGVSPEEVARHSDLLVPKLMFQQIVSHALKPKPHVRLVGAIDRKGDLLSIDTVSNIYLRRKVAHMKDSDALLLALAVLNSRVMSWFTDRFIYARAIRTMHFDNYQLNKMRFPLNVQTPGIQSIIKLAGSLASMDVQGENYKEKATEIERMVNNHVAEEFGLSKTEIELIDENFGDEYLCNMGLLRKEIQKR